MKRHEMLMWTSYLKTNMAQEVLGLLRSGTQQLVTLKIIDNCLDFGAAIEFELKKNQIDDFQKMIGHF